MFYKLKSSCVLHPHHNNHDLEDGLRAGLFTINKINSIKSNEEKVSIDVDDEIYSCDYLIGADGANSVVRKLTSNLDYKNPVFAYEGLVKKDGSDYPTEFIFNKHGYAWIFPKDQHYNVGIGNLVHSSKSKKITKKDLYSFVLDRFGSNKIENITTQIGPENANEVTSANPKFLIPSKIAYIAIAPQSSSLINTLNCKSLCLDCNSSCLVPHDDVAYLSLH